MIAGNPTWTAALAKQYKQPLYILIFPCLGIVLMSFVPSRVGVTIG